MTVLGLALLLASAISGFVSMRLLSQANSGVLMPWWHAPEVRSLPATVCRSVSAALAFVGASLAAQSIGYWSIVLVLCVFAAPMLVQVRHNRQLLAVGAARG
ncbi:hypothetical protein SAMN04489806_1564 [Paramicrobacterium humi]|uniref:Uncharacterized protein n=1 Tax=Paramicrobacterium humi TaxID=640635 RepID=A0A1H4LKH1_9MICO|nr:hypothetical protein [Microbacterium humi]SEB70775.1 hypothetical protein SAMN04489806_1564 [Microbacterium humi]